MTPIQRIAFWSLMNFCLIALVHAGASHAQEDIPLEPDAVTGLYHMRTEIPDVVENGDVDFVCCARVDTSPVIELGCAPAIRGEIIEFDVEVLVSGNSGVVRCYVTDPTQVSAYSVLAYTLDFLLLPLKPPILR